MVFFKTTVTQVNIAAYALARGSNNDDWVGAGGRVRIHDLKADVFKPTVQTLTLLFNCFGLMQQRRIEPFLGQSRVSIGESKSFRLGAQPSGGFASLSKDTLRPCH